MAQTLTALLFSAAGIGSVAVAIAMLRANAAPILRALIGEGAFPANAPQVETLPPVHIVRRATARPLTRPVTAAPFHPARLCVAA